MHGDRHTTRFGEDRSIHVAHFLTHDFLENALQGGELQNADVVFDDFAANLHVDAHQRGLTEANKDLAEVFHQRNPGLHTLVDHTASDVHSVWHEFPIQGQPNRLCHRNSRLFLGFIGGGSKMGGEQNVGRLEQRRLKRRLGGKHIEPGARNLSCFQCSQQGILVNDAAAAGVHNP